MVPTKHQKGLTMSTPFAGGKVDFNAVEPGLQPLTPNESRTDANIRNEERSFAARDPEFDPRAEREFDREDRAFAAATPSAAEFTRDPADQEADTFAPTPAYAATPSAPRKRGINPAFVAIPVIAVVGVGAALLLTSNNQPSEPDLGASLPVETAQAPLANPTLPPADTAVIPPAPVEVAAAPEAAPPEAAPTPAPARATAPARRAAPRVERAAATEAEAAAPAPAAADDLGVDASATLPAGPTTYNQLDRTGDPAPQAINPAGTVTAPAGVTPTAPSATTAPVVPPAPAASAPAPITPPEPAQTPDAPAVDTPQ